MLVCACLVCLCSSLLVCARVCSRQLVCARALLVCARVCFSWPVCARVSVFASFVVVCVRPSPGVLAPSLSWPVCASLPRSCSCLLVCARPSPCERVLCPFVLVCARPGQCVLVCASYFTCLEGSGMRSGVDAKDCELVLPVVTPVAQSIVFYVFGRLWDANRSRCERLRAGHPTGSKY